MGHEYDGTWEQSFGAAQSLEQFYTRRPLLLREPSHGAALILPPTGPALLPFWWIWTLEWMFANSALHSDNVDGRGKGPLRALSTQANRRQLRTRDSCA